MLPITIRKRTITEADLELIQTTVREYWYKGRTQISEILCKKWNWVQPNGRLKDMACREVLLTLKRKGLITLPPRFNPASAGPTMTNGIDPSLSLKPTKALYKISSLTSLPLNSHWSAIPILNLFTTALSNNFTTSATGKS